MKLDSISYKQFKGATASHKLTPLNLIHGSNFAGKTTILDAISLLLSGFHPKLGRRNSDIFALSSGKEMLVEGKIEGQTYWRKLTDVAGSVKATKSPNCDSLNIPSVLIDAKEYFALSDRERIKYVFGMVQIPGEAELPHKIVASVKNHQFEENTTGTQAALMEVVETIMELWDDASGSGKSTQDTVESLITELKAQKSTTDSTIKDLTGKIKSDTALATTPLTDQTQALVGARAKVETLVRELEKLYAAQEAEAKRLVKHDVLRNEISDLTLLLDPAHVATLEAQVRELEAKKPVVDMNKLAELRTALTQMELGLVSARKLQREHSDTAGGIRVKLAYRDQLLEQLAKTRKSAEGLKDDEKAYAKVDKAWQRYLKASRFSEDDRKVIEESVQYCPDPLQTQIGVVLAASVKPAQDPSGMLGFLTAKRIATNQIENIEKQIEVLPTPASLKVAEVFEKKSGEKVAGFESQIKKQRAELDTYDKALADSQEHATALSKAKDALNRTSTLRGQLEQLQKELITVSQVTPLPDITGHQQTLNTQRNTVADLDQKQRQWLAQKGVERQAQEALERRQKLESTAAALKAAVGIVEAEQALLVETSFTEILKTANQLTTGIIKGSLCYKEGTIGYMNGSTFVGNKTCSQGEEALIYSALAISLAASSPIKLLLLDEIGRLGRRNRIKVLKRVAELVASGVIDQALLVEPIDDPAELKPYQDLKLPINFISI